MKEVRYAILIGMNDYSAEPLPYCIKDVQDFKNTLISHCRFSAENIYTIIDSDKPVKEQIDEAYVSIEKNLNPNEDLLLFYFSGHGLYDKDEEKSKILFQDNTELSIEDVLLRYFKKKTPKNLYLLIDACQSGSNIFFKGKNNPEKEIRRLNYHSSEWCLMFATESKKNAIQEEDIQNSYFTYYLIEAIKNNKLYDEDGFLTIQSIDNYIKKKVVEKSDFLQIPVSEIRSSGYKIFSYNEPVIKARSKMKPTKPKFAKKKEDTSKEEIPFEASVLHENREKVQEKCSEYIQSYIDNLITELNVSGLNAINTDLHQELGYSGQQSIFKLVIKDSRKKGIEPVDGIYEIQRSEERKLKFGTLSILDSIYEKPKPEVNYHIFTNSNSMVTIGLSIKAKDIYQVSGGLIVIFFQAKFGFALSIVKYNYSWSGTSERELKDVEITIKPFLLNRNNESAINQFFIDNIGDFENTVKSWHKERKDEIDNFISKTNGDK